MWHFNFYKKRTNLNTKGKEKGRHAEKQEDKRKKIQHNSPKWN